MQNQSCVDIDECQTEPCKAHSRCNNTIGSFDCDCQEGKDTKHFYGKIQLAKVYVET